MQPLVLVHGNDRFLVTQRALATREELTAGLDRDLGLEELRSEADLALVAQSLSTPPFLASHRVVVLWDPPQLSPGPGERRAPTQLVALLEDRLETTAALLVHRALLREEAAILRDLRGIGAEVRVGRRPTGSRLFDYLQDELRRRRLVVGPAVLRRLREVANESLGDLDQELEKLELFSLGTGRVEDEDGRRLVSTAIPSQVYQLTDALFDSPARVGVLFHEFSRQRGFPPELIVGALARRLRELIAFAGGQTQGLKDWERERLSRQASRAGRGRLLSWLVRLADLDWASKLGRVDAVEGLDVLLAQIATEVALGQPA